MSASVAVPLATSQRTIAVKVMHENRRIINQHRALLARGKVSYTHLIGWAIVKALEEMRRSITPTPSAAASRSARFGRRSTSESPSTTPVRMAPARSLMVPNIKNAGALTFQEYLNGRSRGTCWQRDDIHCRHAGNRRCQR